VDDLKIRRLIEQLSGREQEVLHGLLDGRTSKEIAVTLDISPKTIDVHRANVMKKMGVTSSAELIRLVGPHWPLAGTLRLRVRNRSSIQNS
jgi:FixJ family two-component response regulator